MAKSSKKSKVAGLTVHEPAAADSEIQTGNGAAKPKKQSVAEGAAGKPAKATAKGARKSGRATPGYASRARPTREIPNPAN